MVDQLIDTRPSGGLTMSGMTSGLTSMSNPSADSESDEYRYFDPKLLQSSAKE